MSLKLRILFFANKSFRRKLNGATFIIRDRGEDLQIIICYIDINIVGHNKSISKRPHLFKLS